MQFILHAFSFTYDKKYSKINKSRPVKRKRKKEKLECGKPYVVLKKEYREILITAKDMILSSKESLWKEVFQIFLFFFSPPFNIAFIPS